MKIILLALLLPLHLAAEVLENAHLAVWKRIDSEAVKIAGTEEVCNEPLDDETFTVEVTIYYVRQYSMEIFCGDQCLYGIKFSCAGCLKIYEHRAPDGTTLSAFPMEGDEVVPCDDDEIKMWLYPPLKEIFFPMNRTPKGGTVFLFTH